MLDHAEIARLIPHAGAMCLLDRVVSWDDDRILCSAVSHRDPANPLARDGTLPILCGIEYAAQAMALHGALTGAVDAKPRAGYLASVRQVRTMATRFDDGAETLMVAAERVMGDGSKVIYNFTLSAAGEPLLTGRAAVILEAA